MIVKLSELATNIVNNGLSKIVYSPLLCISYTYCWMLYMTGKSNVMVGHFSNVLSSIET